MELEARCFETDWGFLGMAFNGPALRVLTLPEPGYDQAMQALAGPWRLRWGPVGEDLEEALRHYFSGKGAIDYQGPLDYGRLTPFQSAVMDGMRAIPFGGVVSYGELAALAGRPRAARAAGSVCARNPLPLVVPCHRVVAQGGGLGGFGGGLEMKERLLLLEGVAVKDGRVVGH